MLWKRGCVLGLQLCGLGLGGVVALALALGVVALALGVVALLTSLEIGIVGSNGDVRILIKSSELADSAHA